MHQGWLGVMLCRVTRSLVVCVCFVDRCLSFCTFSFGHCVVCSSSIYGFWLPLWYLQTLLVTPLHIYRLWRRTWLVAWLYDITTYLRTQRIETAVEGDIWKGTEEIDVDAEKGCQNRPFFYPVNKSWQEWQPMHIL